MTTNSSFRVLSLALFALSLMALPTMAQAKKASKKGEPVEITIVSVIKKDAMAKPLPDGTGRVIPVDLQWKAVGDAKLVNLEAVLKTSNTDGTTTEAKVMLDEKASQGTLMLKMPNDVFAREYTLTFSGKCVWEGGQGTSRATKSGAFPVPANAGARK